MNTEQFKGNWKQLKGKAKLEWGKLTEDHLEQIDGRKDMLVGKIQEIYGRTKEQAEAEVSKWKKRLK